MNNPSNLDHIIKRFVSYVTVDTESDAASNTTPSTEKQLVLAKMLKEELSEIGMTEVTMDENGYVMATLESNWPSKHIYIKDKLGNNPNVWNVWTFIDVHHSSKINNHKITNADKCDHQRPKKRLNAGQIKTFGFAFI